MFGYYAVWGDFPKGRGSIQPFPCCGPPMRARPHFGRIYSNVYVLNVTKKCFCHGLIATSNERREGDCPGGLSGKRWCCGRKGKSEESFKGRELNILIYEWI
ncbi:hypothetical protein HNY73_004426 [Argiope bruennichi]|uniref:Uncharacterized protein n=1 Tax=Argiope bruennichi TaxID=94029 RepID=A0A8T0FQM4_ARGBR|nr:hypothetical protein HNY73_004426 [Argiope bruennichi]